LRDGARKAVEEHGGRVLTAREASRDELEHQAVRDQATRSQVPTRTRAERRAMIGFLTQRVADREMGDAEIRSELRAQRALARTGETRHDNQGRPRVWTHRDDH
jgi:hypothetical protein